MDLRERIRLTANWVTQKCPRDAQPPLRTDLAVPDARLRRDLGHSHWFEGGSNAAGWVQLRRAIDDIMIRRSTLMQVTPKASSGPSLDGRLMACWPSCSDWTAIAVDESDGFFDDGDVPGWDSWIAVGNVDECRKAAASIERSFCMEDPQHREACGPCILAWVPQWLIPKVHRAIEVMPTRTCDFVSS